jgi:hypothetical protein
MIRSIFKIKNEFLRRFFLIKKHLNTLITGILPTILKIIITTYQKYVKNI